MKSKKDSSAFIHNIKLILGLSSPEAYCVDSLSSSDNTSQPTSLTDHMALVNKILVDDKLDRMERIEKLESVLSSVTGTQAMDPKHLNNFSGYPFSPETADASTQTISTGDINIIKVYSPTKEVKD